MALQTENIIYSHDDVGISTSSWYTLRYGSAVQTNSVSTINNPVAKYESSNLSLSMTSPVPLVGGTTVTPEYCNDPTLGSGAYTEDLIKISQGIPIIFTVYNCSGIYAKTGAWDNSIGGIAVDETLTPNMRFKSYGDSKSYIDAAAWSGGYWAMGEDVKVTLTHSGIDILHQDSKTIKSIIWRYSLTGWFNLQLNLKLDLTNALTQYTFNHPNFYMSGCILSFDMLDRNGVSTLKKTYSGVVIDPPNAVGSITTSTNKSISDVAFSMSRDAVRGSLTYTELHNVTKNTYNMSSRKMNSSNPWYYKNDNISTDSYSIPNSDMGRGGYCYMKYEPKLGGIKPAVVGGIAYTDYVTNCKGHKFNISNVTLKMSTSGIFGVDVLDEISTQNPYVFLDPTNTSGHIKITFNADHEDWSDGTIRDNLPATGIYPYLTGVCAFADNSDIENIIRNNEISYTPYDSATTYPNVDITGSTLDQILAAVPYKTNTLLAGTSVALTSQSITINLLKSGRYKIYLALRDQFNQISLWCITNKANDYKIPF